MSAAIHLPTVLEAILSDIKPTTRQSLILVSSFSRQSLNNTISRARLYSTRPVTDTQTLKLTFVLPQELVLAALEIVDLRQGELLVHGRASLRPVSLPARWLHTVLSPFASLSSGFLQVSPYFLSDNPDAPGYQLRF